MLIHQLAKIAKEDESLRPHLLPIIREAVQKSARDWSPEAPSETGRVRDQLIKELKRRGATCQASVSANAFTCEGEKWAIHGVWLEGPRRLKYRVREPNMQSYITDAANFIEENAPQGRMASDKTAHGPVSMRDPDAMYYMIDPKSNKSKFYEMKIVPIGRETPAKRSKGDESTANWVLMRRWGRLTDSGATGRVDSYNEYWGSRQMAERSMAGHGQKRLGRGYTDVSRTREYPIGLGGAGFGWGSQSACRIIPELMELKEFVSAALGALAKARREVGGVAREDSAMAKKLQGMIVASVGDLQEMDRYLSEQLAHCR